MWYDFLTKLQEAFDYDFRLSLHIAQMIQLHLLLYTPMFMTAFKQLFKKLLKPVVLKGRQIFSHLVKLCGVEIDLITTKIFDETIFEMFGHDKISNVSGVIVKYLF